MRKNIIMRYIIGTALVLLVPLIAMQFSDEVNWSPGDFIIIGTLLLGSSLIYEFVVNRVQNKKHRAIMAIVFFAVVTLIWVHLAVGIVDDAPFAGS